MIHKLDDKFHYHFQRWNRLSLRRFAWKREERISKHKEESLFYLKMMDDLLYEYCVIGNIMINFQQLGKNDLRDIQICRNITNKLRKETGIGTMFDFFNRNYGSVNGNRSHFRYALENDKPIKMIK